MSTKSYTVSKISVYLSEHPGGILICCSANSAIIQSFRTLEKCFDFLFDYRELFNVFSQKTDYDIRQSPEFKEYQDKIAKAIFPNKDSVEEKNHNG